MVVYWSGGSSGVWPGSATKRRVQRRFIPAGPGVLWHGSDTRTLDLCDLTRTQRSRRSAGRLAGYALAAVVSRLCACISDRTAIDVLTSPPNPRSAHCPLSNLCLCVHAPNATKPHPLSWRPSHHVFPLYTSPLHCNTAIHPNTQRRAQPSLLHNQHPSG